MILEKEKFAVRLVELRGRTKQTQMELAKKLNVHESTIKNWENGNCMPDVKNLCAMADLFQVTTDYLLGRSYEDVFSLHEYEEEDRKMILGIHQLIMDRYSNRKGRANKFPLPILRETESTR